jgi:hypothetical protein
MSRAVETSLQHIFTAFSFSYYPMNFSEINGMEFANPGMTMNSILHERIF